MCVHVQYNSNVLEVDTHVRVTLLIITFNTDDKVIFIFQLFNHFIHKIDHQTKQNITFYLIIGHVLSNIVMCDRI